MSAEPSLYTVRDTCRACLSKIGEERYPLAPVSAASPNIGADEDGNRPDTLMPMTLVRCDACGHLQLSEIFDPGVVYAHYQYRTAISLGLVEHFRRTVDDLTGRFPMAASSPLTVEMGSNDGSVLALYQEKGFRVLGVDPASDIVAEANRLGRPSIAGFFTRALSEEIRQEHGAASFIVANNVFANIDDLDDVVSGVAALLADDGVFIVETQDGAEMVAANLLDVVYHEHLSFFTAHSAERLYARLGLELIGVERHATKGGSLRLIAQKAGGPRPVDPSVAAIKADERAKGVFEAGYLSAFRQRNETVKAGFDSILADLKDSDGSVIGFGASIGCLATIHQFGLEQTLDWVLDDTPLMAEVAGPGFAIPVHATADWPEGPIKLVVVLAWRYADAILAKHGDRIPADAPVVALLPDLTVVRPAPAAS